jgi:hypothetical protein
VPHSLTKRIALPGAGVKGPSFVRGARAFSLCSFFYKKNEQQQKYSYIFSKKIKIGFFLFFFAEPSSQIAPDETNFFNTNRATTRNHLAGF